MFNTLNACVLQYREAFEHNDFGPSLVDNHKYFTQNKFSNNLFASLIDEITVNDLEY